MFSLIFKIAMTAGVIGIPLGYIAAYIGVETDKENIEDIGYLIATISIILVVVGMIALLLKVIWS
jgi:uncharacterized membrane protein